MTTIAFGIWVLGCLDGGFLIESLTHKTLATASLGKLYHGLYGLTLNPTPKGS